jgi:hypothetical protein
MKTGTYPQARILARGANNNAEFTAQRGTRDNVRSAGNIQLWQCYLPEDCVDTMIKLGWDQTT